MKTQFVGRNITVNSEAKAYVEGKLTFLNKYLIFDEATVAHVTFMEEKDMITKRVEITIPTAIAVLHAEEADVDAYLAIDKAMTKLEEQIRRQKTRFNRRHRDALVDQFLFEEGTEVGDEDVFVKTKAVDPGEMDLEEAILRMELLGHDFFIYRDDETKEVAVVYKRRDGAYGCIEVSK